MRKINELKNKLSLTFVYIVVVAILYFLKVPCLFKHFLGLECMGCGMTRAMLCALHLDFKSALTYHSMFWSIPILYMYFLFDGGLIGKKIPDRIILTVICIGFILEWISKFV